MFLVARKVRLVVPGVFLGRLVDLRKLLLRRAQLVGSLLRGIAGHVADHDSRVAHWSRVSNGKPPKMEETIVTYEAF